MLKALLCGTKCTALFSHGCDTKRTHYTDNSYLPTAICTAASFLLFPSCLLNSLCLHSNFRDAFSRFGSPKREIHCYIPLFSSAMSRGEPELDLMLCYSKPFLTASKSKQNPMKASHPGYCWRTEILWWLGALSHGMTAASSRSALAQERRRHSRALALFSSPHTGTAILAGKTRSKFKIPGDLKVRELLTEERGERARLPPNPTQSFLFLFYV